MFTLCVCVRVCVCACVHSCLVDHSHLTLCYLWTIAHQVPLSMEFFRQEYWSGLPFLTPGHLPDQGSNPCLLCLLHQKVDSLPLSHQGSHVRSYLCTNSSEARERKENECFSFFLHTYSSAVSSPHSFLWARREGSNL